MDALNAAAASGMRARMDSLDMLANNLANASAPGFKVDREFYRTYLSAEAAESGGADAGSQMPVVEQHWTDYSQGPITPTGNPLDVALKGKGFFVASSPTGPMLTRDGSFRLSTKGELETRDGFTLNNKEGKPIKLDPSRPIEITPDGEVRQDGQTISQLNVVDVKSGESVSKNGMNYYAFAPGSTVPAGDVQLQTGSIEAANFQPAESAVRLVSVMRSFEMLQRAVSIGADMNRRVVEEVAKVGS